jgi:hypothetical protein
MIRHRHKHSNNCEVADFVQILCRTCTHLPKVHHMWRQLLLAAVLDVLDVGARSSLGLGLHALLLGHGFVVLMPGNHDRAAEPAGCPVAAVG